MIEEINHIEEAKERIIYQYKNSKNLKSVIQIIAERWNQFENQDSNFRNKLNIDYASGELLDLIGSIIGLKRGEVANGEDDYIYRIMLKAEIGIKSSQTTFEDIFSIWRILVLRDWNVEIREVYPAEIDFYTNAKLNENLKNEFREILESIIGVGISVGAIVIGPLEKPFALKGTPEDPTTFGLSDLNDPDTGGYLSTLLR